MLSVIIPSYNEEKCIRHAYDAINSLLEENGIECESYVLEKCGHSTFMEKYANVCAFKRQIMHRIVELATLHRCKLKYNGGVNLSLSAAGQG